MLLDVRLEIFQLLGAALKSYPPLPNGRGWLVVQVNVHGKLAKFKAVIKDLRDLV